MFSKIKKFIYFIILYSGFVYILRIFYRKILNNPIRILFTHRVIDKSDELFPFLRSLDYFAVEEFEKKIKYLLKYYRFISLDECLEYLKMKKRPPNSVVLTFDDGYKCVYTKAFPILKKYNIPATIFLTVSFIGNEKTAWHDKLISLIGKTQVKQFKIKELSERIYTLSSLKDKKRAFKEIDSCLKKIDDHTKEKVIKKMFVSLKINEVDLQGQELMLSWDEIKKMHASGLVSFGSHTLSHPILTRVPLERAKYEMQQSKGIIEENLGMSVKFFSYPNGDYDDFNEEIKNWVNRSGYLCACTTIRNNNNEKSDLFALGRDGFTKEPFYMFGLRIAGLFDLINRLKANRG